MEIYAYKPEDAAQCQPAKPCWLRRCVRAIVPRYHHMSGLKQKPRVEYWNGDYYYKASVHLHWNWLGRGHWLVIFLPELL